MAGLHTGGHTGEMENLRDEKKGLGNHELTSSVNDAVNP